MLPHDGEAVLVGLPVVDDHRQLQLQRQLQLAAEHHLLKLPRGIVLPVVVQADLADQIDFAEPGDDLFDSPCFRLPG